MFTYKLTNLIVFLISFGTILIAPVLPFYFEGVKESS